MEKSNKRIISIIVYFFIQLIKQIFLMQKGTCKFEPSCSKYAKEAIEKLTLRKAIIKITLRILKCNPLSKGGYDPVE